MTKTTARLLAALLLPATAFGAATPPAAPAKRGTEYEASQRIVGKIGRFDPLADAAERWQYGGRSPARSFMTGTYFRVAKNLKVGAFYRLDYGDRHDDDWLRTKDTFWAWRDTTNRPEHVLVLDATPRVQLKFLPGGNWVGSLKLRFERNYFSAQNVMFVEPELAWFWMNGLTPRATIFARQETGFALNFGGAQMWQRWWYLAGLWHAKPWLSLGPSIALKDETWSTSSSFNSFAGKTNGYSVLYRAWVAGFTLVYRPG